jgi:hypothetical protein
MLSAGSMRLSSHFCLKNRMEPAETRPASAALQAHEAA